MTTKILMNDRDEFKSSVSFSKKLRDAAVVKLSKVYFGSENKPDFVLKIERSCSPLVLTLDEDEGKLREVRTCRLVKDEGVRYYNLDPGIKKTKKLFYKRTVVHKKGFK